MNDAIFVLCARIVAAAFCSRVKEVLNGHSDLLDGFLMSLKTSGLPLKPVAPSDMPQGSQQERSAVVIEAKQEGKAQPLAVQKNGGPTAMLTVGPEDIQCRNKGPKGSGSTIEYKFNDGQFWTAEVVHKHKKKEGWFMCAFPTGENLLLEMRRSNMKTVWRFKEKEEAKEARSPTCSSSPRTVKRRPLPSPLQSPDANAKKQRLSGVKIET